MSRTLVLSLMVLLLSLSTARAANVVAGQHIAKVKCAGCHGASGAGNGVMLQTLNVSTPPVPWTNKAGMAKFSDQVLIDVIKNGGKQVLGKSPVMPAFGNQFSDADLADLVAYIRSLAE
jgi:mono/diheme cytochrome c family protein